MTRNLLGAVAPILAAFATPAQALLLCLGTEPRFALVSDGATVQFDYLGDGTFGLPQPLPHPIDRVIDSAILPAGEPIPFSVAPRACTVLGVDQAYSITVSVPSNGGTALFRGCCSDRR